MIEANKLNVAATMSHICKKQCITISNGNNNSTMPFISMTIRIKSGERASLVFFSSHKGLLTPLLKPGGLVKSGMPDRQTLVYF